MENPSRPNRRQFLTPLAAIAATSVLAGCSVLRDATWDQTGATDVIVVNTAADPQTVTVTIRDADAESLHTDRMMEIEPGEKIDPVNSSKLPTNTSYTIEATVEGGPAETFEWDAPNLDLAPLWILVDGSRNIKFLLQAG